MYYWKKMEDKYIFFLPPPSIKSDQKKMIRQKEKKKSVRIENGFAVGKEVMNDETWQWPLGQRGAKFGELGEEDEISE